jgi:hypothetical protein
MNVVPPLPPSPPPPSDLQKRIPFYITAVSVAVAGIGTYVQTTLLPNSDFLAMFPYAANIPGICAIVVGFCGTLLASPFFAAANAKKMQDVIDHKDAVIDHKDEVIVNKAVEVEVAAKKIDAAATAPAVVPAGQNKTLFRLIEARNAAVEDDDDEMIDGIRALIRLKKKAGAA